MNKFIAITVYAILIILPILSMILTSSIAWYVTRETKGKFIYILTRVLLISITLASIGLYLFGIYDMYEPIIWPKKPGDADTNGIILIFGPLMIGMATLVYVVSIGALVFIVCKLSDRFYQRKL